MMEPRHIIALMIGEEQLSDIFFREGATFRCFAGVPKDATLLGIWNDHTRRCLMAQFEHPSFPVCGVGQEPERRFVGYEVLEHPHAADYDFVPLKFGAGAYEYLDMKRWICERAAEIEGRQDPPK